MPAKKTKKKKKSTLVKLLSSANTGFFYVRKNNAQDKKLSLKKYDPVVRKHVLFKQTKLTS